MLTATASADDAKYACHEPAADAKLTAEFKPDVTLAELSTWVMGFTCKTVVYEIGVAKNATKFQVMAPRPLTPKQALQLFVDSVDAAGLLVTVKGDTITIKPGKGMPNGCPDVTAAIAAQTPAEAAAEDELEKLIEKGVVSVDDTHKKVSKAVVDKLFGNPMAVAKGVRLVPAVKDGKPQGFKLYAIRPSSLVAKLGFLNGDTLTEINGFELTSADKALEVYTKLRDATAIEATIVRRGKTMKLAITVTP